MVVAKGVPVDKLDLSIIVIWLPFAKLCKTVSAGIPGTVTPAASTAVIVAPINVLSTPNSLANPNLLSACNSIVLLPVVVIPSVKAEPPFGKKEASLLWYNCIDWKGAYVATESWSSEL